MRHDRSILVLALALLVAACAAATEGAPTAAPAAGGGDLAGAVFEAHVPPGAAPQNGDFRISFTETGRILVTHQGRQVYEGEYELRGSELRIVNRSGALGCGGRAAVYTWRIDDRQLVLNRRDDPCATMSAVFTAVRWDRR
jgi:hypothetical protein